MPTLLIIDDDVALLARLSTQLTEAGYDVLRASRAQHAELLIADGKADMTLLDTDMGHGDGWTLLDLAIAKMPVIVISGQGLEEDIIRGLDAGAVDYLPKPFRTGELLARIRLRLRQHAAGRAAPLAAETAASVSQPAAPATGTTTPLIQHDAPPPAPPAHRRRDSRANIEDPVFIPYGEEQRLLREPIQPPADEIEDISQLSLGQRLHAARQRKRITLVQAELETRPAVRMHYIQAMEEEKFSLLPRGPYAEELLRTYAAYLGLDVPQAVDEYHRLHFTAPIEPPLALGGASASRQLPSWLVWLVATVLALLFGVGGIWLYDPNGMSALADRAGLLAAPPPTATATPTVAPPTATSAPTRTPPPTATATATSTPTPKPTARPTATEAPTETPTPTPRR
jgi:CheY-like chemotaxis protein